MRTALDETTTAGGRARTSGGSTVTVAVAIAERKWLGGRPPHWPADTFTLSWYDPGSSVPAGTVSLVAQDAGKTVD